MTSIAGRFRIFGDTNERDGIRGLGAGLGMGCDRHRLVQTRPYDALCGGSGSSEGCLRVNLWADPPLRCGGGRGGLCSEKKQHRRYGPVLSWLFENNDPEFTLVELFPGV
jgi:hypothetical protein